MKDYRIEEFCEHLFSKEPVPGGGGASALAGALGAGLSGMVTNYTIGKKKYAAKEPEMIEARTRLQVLMEELQELMQKDAEAFAPLSVAYGLPKSTPEEIAYKDEVMEKALVQATEVPLTIMKKSYEMVSLLEFLEQYGSVMVTSDVAVAAAMVRAALCGGAVNVAINVKSMKNAEAAEAYQREAQEMLADGVSRVDALFKKVLESYWIG